MKHFTKKWARFALFCSMFLCGLDFPVRAELLAGAAKVNITPSLHDFHVPLGGYAARRGAFADGIHDPLFARALVLRENEAKIGIVSVDLCFLPANIKTEILRRVEAAGVSGLDATHLLISATHTHCATDPLAMHSGNTFDSLKGWTHFDAELLDYTAEKIAEAVIAADENGVPARTGSRRVNLRRKHLNRNRRGDVTVDSDLCLLKVTTKAGKPLAAIFNFAAHPTLYDDDMRELSADWPGVATRTVEQEWGSGAVCLFLNADEGDATVSGATGDNADERVAHYGDTIAQLVMGLLRKVKMERRTPLHAWKQAVNLPARRPNPGFVLAASQFGANGAQAKSLVYALMPDKASLAFAQIGSLLFIGFPCEPTGDIGLTAKALARQAGYPQTALVALTNDWLAYCVTPAQYRAGKYEATMSFYGETFGPKILQAVESGLQRAERETRK